MGKLCNDMQRFTSPLFCNPLILLDSLVPPLGTTRASRGLRRVPAYDRSNDLQMGQGVAETGLLCPPALSGMSL